MWVRTDSGWLVNADRLAVVKAISDPDNPERWLVVGSWEPVGPYSTLHYAGSKDEARRVLDELTRQLGAVWPRAAVKVAS